MAKWNRDFFDLIATIPLIEQSIELPERKLGNEVYAAGQQSNISKLEEKLPCVINDDNESVAGVGTTVAEISRRSSLPECEIPICDDKHYFDVDDIRGWNPLRKIGKLYATASKKMLKINIKEINFHWLNAKSTTVDRLPPPISSSLLFPYGIPIGHMVHVFLIYFRKIKEYVKLANWEVAKRLTKDSTKYYRKILEPLEYYLGDFLRKFELLYFQNKFNLNIEEYKDYHEFIQRADQVHKIIKKLHEYDIPIPEILKITIKPTSNDYIASILGMNEEVATFLNECDDYLTNEQLILSFINRKYEEIIDMELEESEVWSWEVVFGRLGFTPIKSKCLCELAKDGISSHVSPAQWAARHIEYQFKYNILLFGNNSLNEKVRLPDQDYGEPYVIPTKGLPIVEVPAIMKKKTHVQASWFSNYKNKHLKPIRGVKYWFHATDHESARNIISQGIKIQKGRDKMDFSDGTGFYLGSCIDVARDWAERRGRRENTNEAIIVFKLKNDDIFSDKKSLNFNNDSTPDPSLSSEIDTSWTEVVRYFRNGSNVDILEGNNTMEKAEALDSLDYIFGPYADANARFTKNFIPNAWNPLKYQLCLKTKAMANLFYNEGNNVELTIFLCD